MKSGNANTADTAPAWFNKEKAIADALYEQITAERTREMYEIADEIDRLAKSASVNVCAEIYRRLNEEVIPTARAAYWTESDGARPSQSALNRDHVIDKLKSVLAYARQNPAREPHRAPWMEEFDKHPEFMEPREKGRGKWMMTGDAISAKLSELGFKDPPIAANHIYSYRKKKAQQKI